MKKVTNKPFNKGEQFYKAILNWLIMVLKAINLIKCFKTHSLSNRVEQGILI